MIDTRRYCCADNHLRPCRSPVALRQSDGGSDVPRRLVRQPKQAVPERYRESAGTPVSKTALTEISAALKEPNMPLPWHRCILLEDRYERQQQRARQPPQSISLNQIPSSPDVWFPPDHPVRHVRCPSGSQLTAMCRSVGRSAPSGGFEFRVTPFAYRRTLQRRAGTVHQRLNRYGSSWRHTSATNSTWLPDRHRHQPPAPMPPIPLHSQHPFMMADYCSSPIARSDLRQLPSKMTPYRRDRQPLAQMSQVRARSAFPMSGSAEMRHRSPERTAKRALGVASSAR